MDPNQLLSSAVEMGLDLLEKQGSFLPYCMAVNAAGETFIYSPASGSAKANRTPSGTSRTGWKATRRRCWSITPMKPERTCSQRPNARSNRIAVLRHPVASVAYPAKDCDQVGLRCPPVWHGAEYAVNTGLTIHVPSRAGRGISRLFGLVASLGSVLDTDTRDIVSCVIPVNRRTICVS
jgi:hypothetical protein